MVQDAGRAPSVQDAGRPPSSAGPASAGSVSPRASADTLALWLAMAERSRLPVGPVASITQAIVRTHRPSPTRAWSGSGVPSSWRPTNVVAWLVATWLVTDSRWW